MCLALPGQVTAINGVEADVLVYNTPRKAGVQLYPETRVGDYVLVKSGLIVQILPEEDAKDLMALLDEMFAAFEEEDRGDERAELAGLAGADPIGADPIGADRAGADRAG